MKGNARSCCGGLRNPEPDIRNLESGTRNPEHGTRNPEHEPWNLKHGTRNLKPGEKGGSKSKDRPAIAQSSQLLRWAHPEHETRNTKSQSLHLKHGTRNLTHETRNPEPGTRNQMEEARAVCALRACGQKPLHSEPWSPDPQHPTCTLSETPKLSTLIPRPPTPYVHVVGNP